MSADSSEFGLMAPESSKAHQLIETCGATPPDPAKSLFVTDPTALAPFTLQAVMDQIVATGRGAAGQG